MSFIQTSDGVDPVGGVVLFLEFPQAKARTIVHRNFHRGTWVVVNGDVLERWHEANFLERLFVVLHIFVRLGGALVIVEGYARRNHVEHDGAFVGNGCFHHGVELLLVAGKRPAHESGAQRDGHSAGIDRR